MTVDFSASVQLPAKPRSYYTVGPSEGIDYSILDRKPGSFNQAAFKHVESIPAAEPEGETVMIMGQAHFIPFNGEAPSPLPPPPPAEEEPRPEAFHFDVRCPEEVQRGSS